MRKNKKAISIMVAYVLLIMIAITLSVFVYTWLKKQVPKTGEECEADVSLVIEDYTCDTTEKNIDITILNNGLFSVDGFYIRVSSDGGMAVHALNDESGSVIEGKVYVLLKPGEAYNNIFSYSEYDQITSIEIEPFIIKKNLVLCDNAVINIKVNEGECI